MHKAGNQSLRASAPAAGTAVGQMRYGLALPTS